MSEIGAFLAGFWVDAGGASAPEYAVILAMVVGVGAVAVVALVAALQGAMTDATDCLNTTVSGC